MPMDNILKAYYIITNNKPKIIDWDDIKYRGKLQTYWIISHQKLNTRLPSSKKVETGTNDTHHQSVSS